MIKGYGQDIGRELAGEEKNIREEWYEDCYM
jgi:hypothetical protein